MPGVPSCGTDSGGRPCLCHHQLRRDAQLNLRGHLHHTASSLGTGRQMILLNDIAKSASPRVVAKCEHEQRQRLCQRKLGHCEQPSPRKILSKNLSCLLQCSEALNRDCMYTAPHLWLAKRASIVVAACSGIHLSKPLSCPTTTLCSSFVLKRRRSERAFDLHFASCELCAVTLP